MKDTKKLADAIFTVFYGGILGDAVGVPYEFKERGTFKAETMIDGGPHGQPIGSWSDDSSMTLCLIENIIENGDSTSLMKKFHDYIENAYWTAYDRTFDIGNTTRESVLKFKFGSPAELCGGNSERDNGNGALMRIAPLAFTLINEDVFSKRMKKVIACAELTHAHPRSHLACIIYIEILLYLYNGKSLDEAMELASKTCKKELSATIFEKEFSYYERIFDGSIKSSALESIHSTGYVVHTLHAALWACFNNHNLKDAILCAVNMGLDTDTTATVAGSIAGMQYIDRKEAPNKWLEKLPRRKDLDDLLESFTKHIISSLK